MLVLRRRIHEGVVIGDEVRLTVEDIRDIGDGQSIFRATVKLGFQSPRHISIYRNELFDGGSRPAGSHRKAKPAQPQAGELVEIPDAEVRLRIQVPSQIPVRCNDTRSVGFDSEEELDGEDRTSSVVHQVTCCKEDRIVICNNITIVVLNFNRFNFFREPETVSARFAGVGGS